MFIEAISTFIALLLAFGIGIPASAVIVSIKARILGRRLNGYFIISRKKTGGYQLHHHPTFGFYFAYGRKLHRMLEDAIRKFEAGYPDQTLIASSLTFTSQKLGGTVIAERGLYVTFSRLMADFLILCNLVNYRRVDGQWRFAKYIRKVHRTKPMLFVVVKGK